MGFYFRKSLNLGPIKLNFSKSGVGVSTGIKGLRIGTGPNGNYVHAGRKGLYYKKQFSILEKRNNTKEQNTELSNGSSVLSWIMIIGLCLIIGMLILMMKK